MSKLDEWDEMIVKLGLAGAEENPVYRLIDGSSIKMWSKSGNALTRIKRSAVLLRYARENAKIDQADHGAEEMPKHLRNFNVNLTYTDDDGDKILLLNGSDLQTARKEMKGRGKIKIIAEVYLKEEDTRSPDDSWHAQSRSVQTEEVSTGDEISKAECKGNAKSSKPTSNLPGAGAVPVLSVVDTLLSVVAGWTVPAAEAKEIIRVAQNAEKEIRESLAHSKTGDAKSACREAHEVHTKTQSGKEEHAADESASKPDVPSPQPRVWGVRKDDMPEPKVDAPHTGTDEVEKETHADQEVHKEGVEPAVQENVTEESNNLSYTRAFIHGRHTCDSCLMSPIIGPRYHATNLPDYDLCSKCFPSYSGKEIKFEAVELDQDRPFQDKWHFRYAKGAARNRPCRPNRANRRGNAGMRLNRMNQGGPPPKPHDMPPMTQHPHGTPPAAQQPQGADAFLDTALKEAMRRSRDEYEQAQEAFCASLDTKVEADVVVETVQDEAEAEVPTKIATAVAKEDPPTLLDDNEEAENVAESVRNSSFASDAEGNGAVAAELGATFDKVAEAIHEMHSELKRDAHGESTLDNSNSNVSERVEVDDYDTQGITIVSGELTTTTNDQGAGVQGSTVALDDASHNSWHVVSTENQIASDEALAHAAQVIGSALFNNDMARSNENMVGATERNEANLVESQASANSDMSSIGSVPSSVPPLRDNSPPPVNPFLLQRWSSQLETLAGMGFTDQAKYVEICERLHAAKIGCDAGEEDVSVENIIDELIHRGMW